MEFERAIRVLMLESHPPDVQVMKDTLELAGLPAEVTSVTSPEEVLFAAEDGTLDIALLNLELPDVDPAIVDELRSLDGAKRLPIIAFSAEHAEQADHVFAKPVHEAEYMGIVAAIRFYWMSAAPSLPPPPQSAAGPVLDHAVGEPETASILPQRLSGIDLLGLHIEPIEAYLLSMVDGKMDVDEISLSIGAEVKETRAMLRRLAGLGAVAWRAPHPSIAPPPPSAAPVIVDVGFRKPSTATTPESVQKERQKHAKSRREPAHPKTTPEKTPEAEKQESSGRAFAGLFSAKTFSDERKKSIDDVYALLGEADHYELLGVPRDADKKDIRNEYFKLAKLFHTDSLYGVVLEEYGPKMDKVFQALTEAYEVLSKKKKRRAYDAYLRAVSETATLEAPRHTSPPARPSVIPKRADDPIQAQPEPPPKPIHTPEASARTRREIAKKLLARRAGGRVVPRPQASAREESERKRPKPKAAAASLARTLESVSRTTKRDRASRLIEDARDAEKKGNITGAAEALRIASAWRPHDGALAAEAERLRHAALVEKAPAFEKRARYAEKNGNWEEAATCWSRVADVRPDDHAAAMSAAFALIESRGNLKHAAAYAKRAAALTPKDAECQRLLAEVWIAAGMPASAKRCLEAALKLDPRNEKATSLLQGLQS